MCLYVPMAYRSVHFFVYIPLCILLPMDDIHVDTYIDVTFARLSDLVSNSAKAMCMLTLVMHADINIMTCSSHPHDNL